jgi:uncharacterized protein (TIGR00252 family)
MVTVATGQAAEAAVAQQLQARGYKIIDRNWKTKICELDIVAQKDKIIYFVEVKYRIGTDQGSGLDYINWKKLGQLEFAARVWCKDHDWEGDCRLLGAEVSGLDYENISLVEIA